MRWLLAGSGWGISWLAMGFAGLADFTTCTQGSTDSWLLTLIASTALSLLSIALLTADSYASRKLRLLALPHALLIPFAALLAVSYAGAGPENHLCSVMTGSDFNGYPSPWWSSLWCPAQLGVIATMTAVVVYQVRSQP